MRIFCTKNTLILWTALVCNISLPAKASEISFNEAIKAITEHDLVKELKSEITSEQSKRTLKGSWSDPMIRLSAKNFPSETFRYDQTPMTGVELAISQKIPLSRKLAYYRDLYHAREQSKNFEMILTKRSLYRQLWTHIINLRRLEEHLKITEDNIQWIKKIITTSRSMYANGSVTQQALLDLQIRKSELESDLSKLKFSINQEASDLDYLIGGGQGTQKITDVPWHIMDLNFQNKLLKDTRQHILEENLTAEQHNIRAKESGFIPDLTLTMGYTKRSAKDPTGDFFSLSAQLSLPVSKKSSADYDLAIANKYAAEHRLAAYKRQRKNTLEKLKLTNLSLEKEIEILTQNSIVFAENARQVTSNAYRLGASSYIALLQSELKLQNLLFKKADLLAKQDLNTLAYKFIVGDALYE